MISQKKLFYGCKITGVADGMFFSGISSDSRRVREGELFICHRGLHRDGRQYARSALDKGAAAILTDSPIDGIPAEKIFITDDTRFAESILWSNFLGRPAERMTVVAVTGTAGKTSIVYMLRQIMAAAGHKVGIITTVRTLSGERELSLGEHGGSSVSDLAGAMTTPDPEYFFGAVREMADDGCDTLIYEASSQGILYKKNAAVRNDIAIFTNLSPEHLDCHGTMEEYFSAKAQLMKTSSSAVINADDEWMARLYAMYPDKKIVRCSMTSSAEAEIYGVNYKSHGADGIEYMLLSDDAVFRMRTPMIGITSAYNTLEASTAALMLGVDAVTVRDALKDYGGADGRMMKVGTGSRSLDNARDITVFIDYAHTPESLRALLKSARDISGNVTVLFGCGGDRDRSKRAEMAKVASEYADRIIITSDNPRSEDRMKIIDEVLVGLDKNKNHTVIPDRREAVEYTIESAREGEMILLCGKGHEKYEILSDGKHPFDEYAIASEALKKRIERNKKDK